MRTIITHVATVCFLALAIVACKKDDKDTNPVAPPSNSKLLTVAEVKSKYTNAAVTLDDNIKIKGVVISDRDNGNIDSNKIVIQEATNKPGILINLTTKMHTFKAGDVVEVGVSRQKLDLFDGDLAIVDLAVDSVRKTGTDNIQPRVATVKQVQDSAKAWSSTLVTINNGLFDPGNEIFMGTADFTDATGTLKSTTLQQASFKVRPLPYHEVKLTGIVRMHAGNVNVDMTSWYITFFDITDYKPAYTITEDFQQWPLSATSNFQIRTGAWDGYNVLAHSKSDIRDGSYSSRGRILRLFTVGSTITIPRLKGLKSVTVVFAGSLTDTAFGSYSYQDEVLPYNPNRDNVGVKLEIKSWGGLIVSNTYTTTELGKFNTVTFLVKKEDLATMDIDLDSNERLSIENGSSATRRGKPTAVVIDKVILGFDQKDPGIDAALWDK